MACRDVLAGPTAPYQEHLLDCTKVDWSRVALDPAHRRLRSVFPLSAPALLAVQRSAAFVCSYPTSCCFTRWFLLPLIPICAGTKFRTLRWSQADLLNRTLTVGQTKTEGSSGRVVPLNSVAHASLGGPFSCGRARKLYRSGL